MNNQNKENNSTQTPKRKVTSKQVVAMAGVIFLVLLYIATLIVAIVDRTESAHWFWVCLFCTIAVPLLIWIYTWLYGKITGRHTFADAEEKNDNDDTTGSL